MKRDVVNTRQIIMSNSNRRVEIDFSVLNIPQSPLRLNSIVQVYTGLSLSHLYCRHFFLLLLLFLFHMFCIQYNSFFSLALRTAGNEFYDVAVVIWLIIMIMTVII